MPKHGPKYSEKTQSTIFTFALFEGFCFILCVCVCVCGFLRIYFILLLLFWPLCTACGILVPQPGIEPVPLH